MKSVINDTDAKTILWARDMLNQLAVVAENHRVWFCKQYVPDPENTPDMIALHAINLGKFADMANEVAATLGTLGERQDGGRLS